MVLVNVEEDRIFEIVPSVIFFFLSRGKLISTDCRARQLKLGEVPVSMFTPMRDLLRFSCHIQQYLSDTYKK